MIPVITVIACMLPFCMSSTNTGKVRLTIDPNVTQECPAQDVTMECRATGFVPNSINYIQLKHKDQDRATAGILRIMKGSHDHQLVLVDQSVQVKGHLDLKEESSLAVTFANPTADRSGDYVCDVLYFDDHDQLQTSTATAGLLVKGLGMIVEDFKLKQTVQEKDLGMIVEDFKLNQTVQEKDLGMIVEDLKLKLTVQEKGLEECKQTVMEKDQLIADLQTQVAILSCPGREWIARGSRCFKHFVRKITWTDARDVCKKNEPNGRLAEIYSQETNVLIQGMVRDSTWFGLNDRMIEDKYVWGNGTELKYSNWKPGKPDGGRTDNCVDMWIEGFWYDVPCTYKAAFVCQVDIV